ncbi:MAG: hypothetical protein ACLP3K_14235 [Candidatus Acidiferrales bacterium]
MVLFAGGSHALLWIAQMRAVRPAMAALVIAILFCPASSAQSSQGSICVLPLPKNWTETALAENMECPGNNYSLKFDGHKAFTWPAKESIEIDDLDIGGNHRVFVYCSREERGRLSFSFSKFKTTQLALGFNVTDGTLHLWTSLYLVCVEAEESESKLSKKN